MSNARETDHFICALTRLRQAESLLEECLDDDMLKMTSAEVEKIQHIRYGKTWKLYLALCVITKDGFGALAKSAIKRDIGAIRQMMLDVDWLKPTRAMLEERTRELINQTGTYQDRIMAQRKAVLELIDAAHEAGRRTYLIMAPYFTMERLADGYFQRVQAVDQMMPEDSLKIYASWLDADMLWQVPKVLFWDDTHIEIRYAHPHRENDAWILTIARHVDAVYHHSITFANQLVTLDSQVRKAFDMHGAYPEELRLYGRNTQAKLDEQQEKLAMEHAQCMVCVTQNMVEHLKQKYGCVPEKVILLPIFDEQRLKRCKEQGKNSNGRTVVYAGGTQKWQNVETMQKAASLVRTMTYRFFTPQPRAFLQNWPCYKRPKDMEVCSKTPEQVIEAYAFCDYGFLLRDDITVNRVACPTKLVEYLAAGIVPILNTSQIGDFVNDGMVYVSLEDFLSGKLLNDNERKMAVQQNLQVVQKLERRYFEGKRQLCSWLENEVKEISYEKSSPK